MTQNIIVRSVCKNMSTYTCCKLRPIFKHINVDSLLKYQKHNLSPSHENRHPAGMHYTRNTFLLHIVQILL